MYIQVSDREYLKSVCDKPFCKERTVSSSAERIRRLRFRAKLEEKKARGAMCFFCSKPVETLHHLDENQNNNRESNLLGVCHSCHTLIPHGDESRRPYKDNIVEKLKELKAQIKSATRSGVRAPVGVTVGSFMGSYDFETVTPSPDVRGQNRVKGIRVHYTILSNAGITQRFFDSLEDFANYEAQETPE